MLSNVCSIVVVGCGGIGSWLIPQLACFLNAEKWKGRMTFVDGDKYESKNESRQSFHQEALGINKAEGQLKKMEAMYPTLEMGAFTMYVGDDNVASLVIENSAIFVCVDNHPARLRIDKRALELDDCCVFSAGNEEHDGNVTVSLRRGGEQLTRPAIDRHPELALVKTNDRSEGCEDLIEAGNTQLLVTNCGAAYASFMAFHMLWRDVTVKKTKKNHDDKLMLPQELYFDVKQGAIQMVPVELAV